MTAHVVFILHMYYGNCFSGHHLQYRKCPPKECCFGHFQFRASSQLLASRCRGGGGHLWSRRAVPTDVQICFEFSFWIRLSSVQVVDSRIPKVRASLESSLLACRKLTKYTHCTRYHILVHQLYVLGSIFVHLLHTYI